MKRSILGILLMVGAGCGAKANETDSANNMINNGGTTGSAGETAKPAGNGGTGSTEMNAGNSGGAGTGSNETAGSGGSMEMTEAGTNGGEAGSGAPPENCQGFSFDGIKYSPGGSVLPNTCMPFHPTTNNPYAVRCVDAWPWYETQFPGDDFCILPPPPDKGVQYGVHPQGKAWFEQVSNGDMSGYEDANIPAGFVLQDGGEEERNYHTAADTDADQNYYRNSARMRPGSHHMIVSSSDPNDSQEQWVAGSPDGLTSGVSLPGAQRPDENAPKSLEKPTEDKGLYAVLPGNPGVTFNMHHFNSTGGPILKEAWTNLWWESDATNQVRGILGLNLSQAISLAGITAGNTADLHFSWDISQEIRLVTAFGHRHAWTTNFTSWVEKPGGDLEIIYQSFDWFDEPTYRYDSMTQNPVPAPEMLTDGASSGIRMLMPGEKLHFNCHIEFTEERAIAENAPSPSTIGNLRFANQAYNAEMCILFGSTVDTQLSNPLDDLTPLPDFATVD